MNRCWMHTFNSAVRVCDENGIKINGDEEGKGVKVTVMKPQFKAFMENITVFSKGAGDAKSVVKRLDESITKRKIKFKAK